MKVAGIKGEKPNDECYTLPETAEYLLDKYEDLFKDKKIILPCDTENSELYKACLRHNIDCEIGQDMFNTDYTKYDLVFTNPPFSFAAKYIKYLHENNIKFVLFAGWITALYASIRAKDIYYIEDFDRRGKPGEQYYWFIQPDGNLKAVHWGLISNLPEARKYVEAKPPVRTEPQEYWSHHSGIYADYIRYNYLDYDWRVQASAKDPKQRLQIRKRPD